MYTIPNYNENLELLKNNHFLNSKKPNKIMLDFWLLLINFDIILNIIKQ